jgi:hypothetical protein
MAAPARDDGQMLIQLAKLGSEYGLNDAIPAIFADGFDPDSASIEEAPVRIVLAYGELIGTLVKHELISVELVHDYLWIAGLWARVGPTAKRQREKHGEPRLYENFEALAQGGPA